MTDWGRSGAARGLLEREHELELLEATVARAAAGDACAIVIEGDPGLGKTALLEVVAELAADLKFTVLRARGGSLERTLGWGVARQLFEGLVVRSAPATRKSLLRGSAGLAAPLFGLSEVSAQDDSGFGHGLYWLANNLAECAPLALLVDDAHWCDDPSLRWWLYLLRRSEALPLLMVIAKRSGETDAPTTLLDTIAAEEIMRTITLQTLGVGATDALLERSYGKPVESEFGLACHVWTGGNPLFVTELAAELAAEGIAPVESAAPVVRSLTLQGASRVTLLRLARCTEGALRLAQAASVLDPGAERSVAAALAELSEDETSVARDELSGARILAAGDPLAFVHPLIGGIVYDDLPAARRARKHRRAAELLLDAGAEPGRVAAHLLRTSASGDAWVVDRLLAGADVELERGSPSTAVQLLSRARGEPPAPATLARVLSTLGNAQARSGDPGGFETLRDAISESADAGERGRIALTLGQLNVRAGQPEAAIEIVMQAADGVAWSDVDLRLQLEALLITLARFAGGQLELISERQAIVRDHATDDTHGGRLVAGQLAWSLSARAQPAEQTVEFARLAIGGGRLVREAPDTPEAWLGPIHMLTIADELAEADRHWTEALRLAERHGSEAAFAAASCYRSITAHHQGRLGQAELYARDALRTTSSSLSLVHRIAEAHLAQALVDRGAAAEACDGLGVGNGLADRLPRTWSIQTMLAAGRALVAIGRPDDGAAVLLDAGRLATRSGILNPAWLPWRTEAALPLNQLGRAEEALRLCEEELELARRFGARRAIGAALRARGLVLGGSAGIEQLREAAETLAQSPARLEYTRALVTLGAALRRGNRRAQAREPLSEGLALADQCGAAPLASEARSELLAAGSRPRAVFRTGAEALTASERRVCELAAAGKSNREIAQVLFVTRATVESHLHSAYRRLDIESRDDLAGALAAAKP